jgi:hypothetical protein
MTAEVIPQKGEENGKFTRKLGYRSATKSGWFIVLCAWLANRNNIPHRGKQKSVR